MRDTFGRGYTVVRASGYRPTRPITEIQSGDASAIALTRTTALRTSCNSGSPNTRNSNSLQAKGKSVMRVELTGSSLRELLAANRQGEVHNFGWEMHIEWDGGIGIAPLHAWPWFERRLVCKNTSRDHSNCKLQLQPFS